MAVDTVGQQDIYPIAISRLELVESCSSLVLVVFAVPGSAAVEIPVPQTVDLRIEGQYFDIGNPAHISGS